MKKILLFSFIFLLVSPNILAEDLLVEKKATEIYEKCKNGVYLATISAKNETQATDIIKEQQIRECLIDEIISITQDFMANDEINDLKKMMEEIEDLSDKMFRILIFCAPNEDDSWCRDSYRQENSLGKLVLERSITSQIYYILINVLKSKSGGFVF